MSRISRNLLENVITHNMVQGINKEYIFKSEYQKKRYINLIKEYSKEFDILIIAYCIMDNHAHLLTYSQNIESLSYFMKKINMKYAIYYNKVNNRVGYVFRNRFYSKPILNQEHLYKCIKYIHMNPVKANISKKESDYKFSSYKDYFNQKDFLQSDVYKIIFYSNKKNFEKFQTTEYETLNFEKENINLKEKLNEFISENNLKSIKISKDSLLIKKFISYLISNEYEFTKKEIAEALGISRAQLYRKLKEIQKEKI